MSLVINSNVASLLAQQNLVRTFEQSQHIVTAIVFRFEDQQRGRRPGRPRHCREQQAQVAGLQSAINNTNQGVSLVQTAEGALSEISSLLTQIRGLAVTSSNSAVEDPTALQANQAEITNALSTINNIANNTQFGSSVLLNGTMGQTLTGADVANLAVSHQVTSGLASANLAAGSYHLKITTPYIAPVTGVAAASTAALGNVTGAATFFNTQAAGAGTAVAASAVQNASYFTEAGNVTLGGKVYAYTSGTQVSTVLAAINADGTNRFSVSLSDANSQFTVTAKNTGAVDNGQQLSILGATKSANVAATEGGVTAVTEQDAAGEIVTSTGASLANRILLTAKPASGGTALVNTALGIEFDVNPSSATTGNTDLGSVYSITSSGNAAVFQIGANAGQTASTAFGDMRASALGVVNGNQFANLGAIDVTAAGGAQAALAVVDKAINQVTTLNGDLGAFQTNTLQATNANLQTALTNTTSALSTIQDTDFASETANYTKNQILLQAGTTVLANANQLPQLVMNLLK